MQGSRPPTLRWGRQLIRNCCRVGVHRSLPCVGRAASADQSRRDDADLGSSRSAPDARAPVTGRPRSGSITSISTASAIGLELGKCLQAQLDTDTIIKRALAEPIEKVGPLHYYVVFAALTLEMFAISARTGALVAGAR